MEPTRQRRFGAGKRVPVTLRAIGFVFALGLSSTFALAQGDALSPSQRSGRQIFAQACGVCHLSPNRGAATYGPPLNQASASRNDELMRAFITEGTARMPAFKYYLSGGEIDSVIAYLRTVPALADAQASREKAQ